MKLPTAVFGLLLLGAATPAGALEPSCSPLESFAAEAVMDYLDDWRSIRRAYQEFGGCDDGYIAESFSEAVTHVLNNRWSDLLQLKAMIGDDKAFGTFVLKHVDASGEDEDLRGIAEQAKHKCPKGAGKLCKALGAAARKALSQQ